MNKKNKKQKKPSSGRLFSYGYYSIFMISVSITGDKHIEMGEKLGIVILIGDIAK